VNALATVIGEEAAAVLAPEHALALALSRRDLDKSDTTSIREALAELGPQFSWGEFVDTCARHGVLPLVGRHLHSRDLTLGPNGESLIPYRWLYAQVYAGNMQRNQLLAAEYGHVLQSLSDADVRCIVRKGPVLLERVHGDLGVRRVGDFDLLVPDDGLGDVRGVLEREGYRCAHRSAERQELVPFDRLTTAFWAVNMPNVQLPYLKVADSDLVETYVIDVCVDLFQARSGLKSDFEDFWRRSAITRQWGVLSRSLAPIDQIIDVCVQFHVEATVLYYIELGKDLTLMKLSEIAELARLHLGHDAGTADLMQRAEVLGCRESLYYALWHAHALYPRQVPEPLVQRLGDGCDGDLLNVFGRLDGAEEAWTTPFLERLFNRHRSTVAAGSSTVPGPRAVL
jgi:hypothetical protein